MTPSQIVFVPKYNPEDGSTELSKRRIATVFSAVDGFTVIGESGTFKKVSNDKYTNGIVMCYLSKDVFYNEKELHRLKKECVCIINEFSVDQLEQMRELVKKLRNT